MMSMARTKRIAVAVAALGMVACVSAFAYGGEATNDATSKDAALSNTVAVSSTADSDAGESIELAPASEGLIAQHEAIGQDISSITEVSIESCSPCHGDWDAIVAATADMWAPLGQITAANPHASHASAAYACEDCHSLTQTQVLQCGACHEYFELPDGWVHKDPTTSIYGSETEPMYSSTLD